MVDSIENLLVFGRYKRVSKTLIIVFDVIFLLSFKKEYNRVFYGSWFGLRVGASTLKPSQKFSKESSKTRVSDQEVIEMSWVEAPLPVFDPLHF